ncbi:hypothetical protein [Methylobacterium sp. SI9]|uniref:hypothetical protein n=1 Tax=Methylobacterium guangdongense TaxID=3138811 RepID=UPI00313E1626
MSQDEALRMVAEVVDKSTGPLKGIREMLRGVAREGKEHTETITRGMGRLESGMKGAASTATSVLSPALATVGITGLTLGATIAGIGAALRNFGGSAKELGTLSRDTGIAASTLREVQGVLNAVGVDAGTSGQALQKFAEEARLAHRGFGPLMEFLRRQGRDESGRAYFNGLANDIMRSKDAGDAYMKALKGLEGIKDPVERRIYAENILKLGDAARLADGRLGSLDDQIARFRRNNGVVTDQDIKDAEAYARAMDALQGTMGKLYNAVARELTPSLTAAATALKGFMDDQRNGVQSGIVSTIQDIKSELAKIDWAQAGKDSLAFFRETTALAGTLARDLHTIVEAMRLLRAGDVPGALRESTGGGGTVGRLVNKFYPRPDASTSLDEQLDAQMRGQDLSADQLREHQNLRSKAPRVAEIEARQAEIRGKLDQFGLMQKGGTDSERSRQTADDLRREMTRLTDELKRIREGGATVQQQSFDATGGGLGGLIQKASYGGGSGLPAVRQMLRSGGGIYAPGGGGYGGGADAGDSGLDLYGGPSGGGRARGPAVPGPDSPAGQVGRQLRATGDSGRFNAAPPEAEGTYRPRYDVRGADLDQRVINTIAGEVSTRNSGGVDVVISNMLNRVGTRSWGPSANLLEVSRARGQYAGYRRASEAESEFIRERIRAVASGGVPDNTQGSNSYRAESYYRGEGRNRTWARTSRIGPSVAGNRYGYVPGAPNGPYAPYAEGPRRSLDARADGNAFQATYRARQEAEDDRAKSLELRPAARSALQNSLRAGAVGATQTAERALMDVRIHNPGPNTRASVVAKGSMFGEVKQMTGRQMRSSDDL